MSESDVRRAFLIQEGYCIAMDAPITARVCHALSESLDRDSATGRRVLDWPGEPTADALPLRLVGGLHALDLAGADGELSAVFAGTVDAPDAVADVLRDVLVRHDAALSPWLDGPPQTNEPGRSAALLTGLLDVARRYGPKLALLEIGSSAGLNLLIDRYRFDLGGTMFGPADARVTIAPEWRGDPPAAVPLDIVSVRGCDVAPVDVRDPAAAARLRAYVWADNPARLERLSAAIAMVAAQPVALDRGDAATWLEAQLAEPQADGVTRAIMHSVVWQYLGAERQAQVRALIETAGAAASDARPFTWVRMEPDRATARMEVRVTTWPGGAETLVAEAQAHGAWVRPLA